MASAPVTCAPGSPQLRWAFNCGNCKKLPPIVVRRRLRKLDRPTRLLCVAENGERRLKGSSWVGSASASESFSGWSDSKNEEDGLESKGKNELGGIVGVGVAGIVLVAGLTYATLSLSKQKTSRPIQQMEPLTTQQEELLTSDDQMDTVGNDGTEDDRISNVDTTQENKDFVEKESDSSLGLHAQVDDDKFGDNIVNEISSVQKDDGTSNSIDRRNDSSIQENLQYESAVADNSAVPETETANDQLASFGLVGANANPAVDIPESRLDPDNNLVYAESKSLFDSLASSTDINGDQEEGVPDLTYKEGSNMQLDSSSTALTNEPKVAVFQDTEASSVTRDSEPADSYSTKENPDQIIMPQISGNSSLGMHDLEKESSRLLSVSPSANTLPDENSTTDHCEVNRDISYSESAKPRTSFSSAGIPAPSIPFAAQQVPPGKVLVPAVVDQMQGQALAALQVLKVIEADVQPSALCTRREYARWLVSASNSLSRNSSSKVYPAMYIENVTELAFDDITPEDPDFTSIQGLAEAGLISSKLSRHDLLDDDSSPFYFSPDSPLSRQDLVSWKMVLEKRQLPEADKEILYEASGFIDVDKINPDACPALLADLSAGEQGIIAHAFGYTKLFQPDKPVTKAQVAIALATGEASDIVSEELARIEAESMAEKAVADHNALVAEVEKDINASYQKELSMEREKIEAIGKMAEEATRELERLKAEREAETLALMKERAALDSEMEVLSRLRREVEEQLESLLSNKVEVAYEKEQINKLRKYAETESQEIARLQYELEVERKALSMARVWAEDEARRASEQAKALEEARDRWERYGIKVVVDEKLREETTAGATWVNAGKEFSVEETVERGENLVDKLKAMAEDVKGKSRVVIETIIQKIKSLISDLKDWISKAGKSAEEVRDAAISRTSKLAQELQQSSSEIGSAMKEGAKRVAGDCREGIEKLTQKFRT